MNILGGTAAQHLFQEFRRKATHRPDGAHVILDEVSPTFMYFTTNEECLKTRLFASFSLTP